MTGEKDNSTKISRIFLLLHVSDCQRWLKCDKKKRVKGKAKSKEKEGREEGRNDGEKGKNRNIGEKRS